MNAKAVENSRNTNIRQDVLTISIPVENPGW